MTTPNPGRPTEQTRVRVVPLEPTDIMVEAGVDFMSDDIENCGSNEEVVTAIYSRMVANAPAPTPAEAPEPTPAKAEAVDTKNATPEVKFLCDLHERFLREYANAGWLSPDYAKGETWGSLAFDILKVAIRLEKLERVTQAAEKAEPGEAVSDLEDVVDWVARYGGDCRDCADENGKCPNDGLPCDDRGKPIRFVVEALRYGIANGYVKPFYARPSADLDRLRQERDAARKEAAHWKANYDEMVRRNAVLRDRPDLPVDRLPALARLREENETWRSHAATLLANLDYLTEATGEGPEDEDRVMVEHIRSELAARAARTEGGE
ncbi:hypothetical protein SAMN06297251_10289 [Fulvimarina manganoxydans]|uniref:Uncharacterized protein n=1 Tax=Fulvimarina manganoxydans TaxID=937218 RepID=A0A1W1YYI9_9HYPH|nr:hypothetical protein [Fulvimarina manganoxydans]SMC41193.1 hypothetical protein SAMN06297251_10289 [Fulvimarina manganoxydans]